jgi:hypothetical protein
MATDFPLAATKLVIECMYYTRLRSGRRLPRLTDAGLWQYYVDEIEANAPYTAEVTQALDECPSGQASRGEQGSPEGAVYSQEHYRHGTSRTSRTLTMS